MFPYQLIFWLKAFEGCRGSLLEYVHTQMDTASQFGKRNAILSFKGQSIKLRQINKRLFGFYPESDNHYVDIHQLCIIFDD